MVCVCLDGFFKKKRVISSIKPYFWSAKYIYILMQRKSRNIPVNDNTLKHYTDKTDLMLMVAYIDKICEVTGLSVNKVLIKADIQRLYYYDIKKYLEGYKWRAYKKTINLKAIVRLYNTHKVPFNMSDYLHILEDNK